MKKFMWKFFLVVSFIFKISILFSQQLAEDFTLTDILGVERNLYQELDQQKVVVLDFFITNCGTCQINTPKLDSIWQQYGYNGDSLWVWGIESSGKPDSQIVDFVNTYQVSFPCFSTLYDDVVLFVYHITYTPQYFVVCPDKSMKQVSINQIESAIIGCKQTKTGTVVDDSMILYWNNEFLAVNTNHSFSINVFNMMGQLIFSKDNILSPIHLPLMKGVYLVKVVDNEKSYQKLILKY